VNVILIRPCLWTMTTEPELRPFVVAITVNLAKLHYLGIFGFTIFYRPRYRAK